MGRKPHQGRATRLVEGPNLRTRQLAGRDFVSRRVDRVGDRRMARHRRPIGREAESVDQRPEAMKPPPAWHTLELEVTGVVELESKPNDEILHRAGHQHATIDSGTHHA